MTKRLHKTVLMLFACTFLLQTQSAYCVWQRPAWRQLKQAASARIISTKNRIKTFFCREDLRKSAQIGMTHPNPWVMIASGTFLAADDHKQLREAQGQKSLKERLADYYRNYRGQKSASSNRYLSFAGVAAGFLGSMIALHKEVQAEELPLSQQEDVVALRTRISQLFDRINQIKEEHFKTVQNRNSQRAQLLQQEYNTLNKEFEDKRREYQEITGNC